MRVLLALGGNALLRRGEAATARHQQRSVDIAAMAMAAVAEEHELVLAHRNGPQVGRMLELALRNALPDRDLISVLTQVVVAADDLAFRDLVPSPEPHAIAEIRSLRVLVGSGALVICAGAGGIPIALDGLGVMHGVEAVVDKDLTAALLARRLDVDLLAMLTDVDAVYHDWRGTHERPIFNANPRALRAMDFAAGSMAPKVEAACRFAEATGRRAAIGALSDVARLVRGEAGTQVSASPAEPALRSRFPHRASS
jgi:carbamate kinase